MEDIIRQLWLDYQKNYFQWFHSDWENRLNDMLRIAEGKNQTFTAMYLRLLQKLHQEKYIIRPPGDQFFSADLTRPRNCSKANPDHASTFRLRSQ